MCERVVVRNSATAVQHTDSRTDWLLGFEEMGTDSDCVNILNSHMSL